MARDSFEIARTEIDIVELATRAYGQEPVKRGSNLFISCMKDGGGADTDPSTVLYTSRNGFHCFHCGWHGSIIDFVMGWKSLSTPMEALAELNRMYPALGLLNEEMRARATHREIYLDKCKTRVESENIKILGNKKLMSTLLEVRGISEMAVNEFHLGLSTTTQFPRLSIPQFDSNGNATAFVTRRLVERDTGPRYWSMNIALDGKTGKVLYNGEAQSSLDAIIVWRKGAYLYNLDRVGNGVIFDKCDIKTNDIMLVEGHLDVVAAWELGINNAAAYGMKLLTDDQALLLEPFSCITLVPDTDAFDEVYNNVATIRQSMNDKSITIVDLSLEYPDDPGGLSHVKDVGDVLKRSRRDGSVTKFVEALRNAETIEQWLYNREVAPFLAMQKAFAYTRAQRLLRISTEPISRAYLLSRIANDFDINPTILSFVTS